MVNGYCFCFIQQGYWIPSQPGHQITLRSTECPPVPEMNPEICHNSIPHTSQFIILPSDKILLQSQATRNNVQKNLTSRSHPPCQTLTEAAHRHHSVLQCLADRSGQEHLNKPTWHAVCISWYESCPKSLLQYLTLPLSIKQPQYLNILQ
jgi:hypothetical protein